MWKTLEREYRLGAEKEIVGRCLAVVRVADSYCDVKPENMIW